MLEIASLFMKISAGGSKASVNKNQPTANTSNMSKNGNTNSPNHVQKKGWEGGAFSGNKAFHSVQYLSGFRFKPGNFQDLPLLWELLFAKAAIFCSKKELRIAILEKALGFFCFALATGSLISGLLRFIGGLTICGLAVLGEMGPWWILCLALRSSVWLVVKDLK